MSAFAKVWRFWLVGNSLFWSCRNDFGIDHFVCFMAVAIKKRAQHETFQQFFFHLFVNFCEVSRRFSCNFIAFYFVQHLSPTSSMTLDVPSSSVVRHRCCLLPLACRASLPFSLSCYCNPGALGIVSYVKSIKRERRREFTLLNLVRFVQNEWSRVTKLFAPGIFS